jgi:hypothetical protein
MTIHTHLVPRLKKEQSYICTPLLCLHGVLGDTFTFTTTINIMDLVSDAFFLLKENTPEPSTYTY